MIVTVRKQEEEETQYKVGVLYIQKSAGTIVLCDRNSNRLRGIVIEPGKGYSYCGVKHFIGEYRADWHDTFVEFDGEITLTQ